MSDLDEQIHAIRRTAGMNEAAHVHALRVSGPDAFDVVDHLCATELHLVDGRMRPALLLDPDGRVFADLVVCRDGDDFVWMVEGPGPGDLLDYIRAHAPRGTVAQVTDLSATHELLSLHGPWAGVVAAAVLGEEVVGLPYLSFCDFEDGTCFRAGKTGEYGYEFLVARERAAVVRSRMLEAGRAVDLVTVGVEALDRCALENFFFNARREGACRLTPLELQLQWRIGAQKGSVGVAAVIQHRSRATHRVTCVIGLEEMAAGDAVHLDDRPVGRLLVADPSWTRGGWIGLALLEHDVAVPGLSFEVVRPGGRGAIRSVAPPVVANRSLFVDPRRHRYSARYDDALPPLAAPLGPCV